MRCDDNNELKTEGNAAWPLITIAADGFHEFILLLLLSLRSSFSKSAFQHREKRVKLITYNIRSFATTIIIILTNTRYLILM